MLNSSLDQRRLYTLNSGKAILKVAVPQIQGLCHQYVVRNKTAGKQSGKVEEKRKLISPLKLLT